MKKIKILFSLFIILFSVTGCLKRDNLDGANIYTTIYPIKYITERLYGDHSNIYSIYPNGVNVDNYTLTDKQIKDYSSAQMYIFNGLDKDKDYVIPMFNNNKNLKIIDTTLSMEYIYNKEELWLDPSNFLMLAQNVRNGLKEYISNHYLKNEIDQNYDELKIEVSNLDAKLKLMIESSNNKTIVVGNDVFKFLTKYDFNVISLEENENLSDKTIADVKELIKSGQISYIYMKQNEEPNDTIKTIMAESDVELLTLHSISNLTETEIKNKKSYLTIMNDNIELLKNELYED